MQADPLSARMREICALAPVVPALVVTRVEDAVPLARALVAGGLAVIEVMFRSEAAEAAMRAIAAEVAGAVPGAGTVLDAAQMRLAARAGARFAVSPGATAALTRAAREHALPFLPGAATASEAMQLAEDGWTTQKFFPAQASGGAAVLAALAAPLPHVAWCPTGGVGPDNAAAYLGLPNVVCVGGSWVAPAARVAARDWSGIEALAREASRLR